jgi:DNA-binding NtrC family response regulator
MSLNIFYLDDETDLLEIFIDTFSSPDRVITTFSDPLVAVEAIRKTPPDILFIDYRLPKFTGEQIAQMIDPQIPKALVTGDLEVKCKYDFVAVLEKPYNISQIEELLEKIKKDRSGSS